MSRTSRKSLPANLSTSNTNKMAKVAKRVVKAAKMSIANPVKLLKKARADKNPENKTPEKRDHFSSEDDRDCSQVPSKGMEEIQLQDDLSECPQKEQSLADAQEVVPFEVQEEDSAFKSDVESTLKNSLPVEAAVKEVASKSGKFQLKSSKDTKHKESVQKPTPIEEANIEDEGIALKKLQRKSLKS